MGKLSKRWGFNSKKFSPTTTIVGFLGEWVDTRGYNYLYTTFGEGRYLCKTIKIRYLRVNANTSYIILLTQSSINCLKAIVSTPHLAMKFPSAAGDIVTLHVDQILSWVLCRKLESWTNRSTLQSITTRSVKREKRTLTRVHNADQRFVSRDEAFKKRHMVVLVDLDPQLNDPHIEPSEDLR